MKEIKSVGDNIIFEKRSGRYAVLDSGKKYINGDQKAKILAEAGLVKIPEPKAEAVEEASEEQPAEDSNEQASEE